MQRTYNLSLFNSCFKDFLERKLITHGWTNTLFDGADFSDFSSTQKIQYGFPNTHNIVNIRNIFKKIQKNNISYKVFTKKNIGEIQKFFEDNEEGSFYLRCSSPLHNKTSYLCKNFEQAKNIIRLRYNNVPSHIPFLLDKMIPTIFFDGNRFTINVLFCVYKRKEKYEVYVYPDWAINVKNEIKRSENKELNYCFHLKDGQIIATEIIKDKIISPLHI